MLTLHGGDRVGFLERHGRMPVDFSVSLNPMGMPETVRDAARLAVDDSAAYPDPLCRELAGALAARLRQPVERILLGNGSAEIIHRVLQVLKPKKALLPEPSFAEYERALAAAGCRVERHFLSASKRFSVGRDLIDKIAPDTDVLVLCQPNNPTGEPVDPGLLGEILARTARTGTLLFMDECFCPFMDDPAAYSLMDRIADHDNLFVLGSFTKLYGMAGIRLGFGLTANRTILRDYPLSGQPWSVSTIAQRAGLAALRDERYLEESLAFARREKKRLRDALLEAGFDVFGSAANYIFFFSPVPDLGEKLAGRGIMIRDCASFAGLERGFFRVGVRTRDENSLLLRAITDCMDK